MTNLPPPDPRSSPRTPLGFDEFVGIFVAFAVIGAIFFWVLSRRDGGFQVPEIVSVPLSSPPATQPTLTPSPETVSPESILPLPPAATPRELPAEPPSRPRGETPAFIPLPTAPAPSAPAPTETPAAVVPAPIPTETPTPPASPSPTLDRATVFADVPEDFWAYTFITALAAQQIVSGYSGDYFHPEQPVTRAEFSSLLLDAFNRPPGQTTTKYTDVPPNYWAATAIERATSAGFLRGYPGDVFQPEQQIPKAQILVALATGLNLTPPSNPEEVLQVYQDAAQIPDYAREKVAAATAAGLVVNYPEQNLLNPNANASRAEVAAIIHQALVNAGQIEPVESQYILRRSP